MGDSFAGNDKHPDVLAIEAVTLTRTCRKTVGGKGIEDQVRLLPGCTFFQTEVNDQASQLAHISNVFKLLERILLRAGGFI